jgi:hypothetical protein
MRVALDWAKLVDRLAQNVHHAPQRWTADWHSDGLAEVVSLHTADHAFHRFHGDGAHAALAEVLLYFGGHVQRLGQVVTFAGDANGVEDRGQVSRFKLNVEHGSDDLHNVSDTCVFLCHAVS